jgi:Mg-chelatase subunit ChlD
MVLQGGLDEPDCDFSSYADDDQVVPAAAAAPQAAQPEPQVSSGADGPITVSTRVEYTALSQGKSQDVFGIVTLKAADAVNNTQAAAQRQPLDIICVLDVSGSMRGDKIRLVQDAVRFVIRESQPQDRLSIVAFNQGATRPLRLCRMDGAGKDEATAVVLRLQAGGGTNIGSGLEAAVETAERRRQRNPVSAILLLTDGQDSCGGRGLSAQVSRAQRAGCALYAFGFGADHDARILSDVAEQAQTPFTYVEDVEHIGAAFAGAIGGLSSVAAQRVEVTIDCKVPLKTLHTPFSMTREGDRAVVQIPDMLAGERRDVVVELSVPEAHGEDTLLLEASAKYWDLAGNAAAQTPAAAMVTQRPAEEPQPELEPDEEVTTHRNRVEVARTLEQATDHGEAGRFEEAQAILSAHEQRLKSGKRTAISEGLAAELQDAYGRMKSRSSWEQGGMAEVRDAMQMHKCQRTTNVSISSRGVKKASKAMYCTKTQESWIRSSASGS